MFTLSEMKLLMIQLTSDIKQTQLQVHQTPFDDPHHIQLENRLITLIAIKKKVANKLENQCNKENNAFRLPKTLIVDDSDSVRDAIRSYFLELGFDQVDMAADGAQALNRLKQNLEQPTPYGLLVTDWNMPKMNGLELLKSVRQDKHLHDLPTYIITGIREKELIMQAIKHGVNGYLVKPINYNHIKKKFSKYLSHH